MSLLIYALMSKNSDTQEPLPALDLINKSKGGEGPLASAEPGSSYPEEDLWARGNETKGHVGGTVKYREQDGNYVQWLLDGAQAMYEMCDAFCRATEFIYIIGCFFSPGINMVRGSDYDKISGKYPNIIDKVRAKNKSKNGVKENTIPLVSLLAVKAQDQDNPVNVRIVLTHPDISQNGSFGWKEAYEMVRDWSDKIDIRLAMWGGVYEGHELGVHHQKSAIVGTEEGLIGFCGGVDFAFARWAIPGHVLDKEIDILDRIDLPLRIDAQMSWIIPDKVMGEWDGREYVCNPGNFGENCKEGSQVLWHDFHAKVVGPAALDLAHNFVERYNNAKTKAEILDYQIDAKMKPHIIPPKADLEEEIKTYKNQFIISSDLLSSDKSYSKGKVRAQILRSYYHKKGDEDYGIWEAYRNLLGKAKKNIYIESQYAFEDGEVQKVLIENIKKNKELKVIIVAPVMPDHYDSVIIKNLKELVKSSLDSRNPKDYSAARVKVYSLISNINSRRVPIYVHAKIAVIDDEWAIVGSANLDRMGMGGATSPVQNRGSSELAILVHGKDQALVLRNMLAGEHLGSGAPSNLNDFNTVFNAFDKIASKNGKPKNNGPITGQLVCHRLYDLSLTVNKSFLSRLFSFLAGKSI
ncbi:phospholipase D1/2 [Methanosarcinales archaeon]|nr:phospholipase D1/2 [Methanosarcinales archaeon]